MEEIKNPKIYDLEERTQKFVREVIIFVSRIKPTLANVEIIKQLVRSAGSVGANYIEANESLSNKDYFFRVKICRKEAKESRYWLTLLQIEDDTKKLNRTSLENEAIELTKIFGSIIEKSK